MPQQIAEKAKTGRLRSKTGGLYRARQPLTPPDAFRAFHWLAPLSFIMTEMRHEGSIGSYLLGYWCDFSNYTRKETLVQAGSTKSVSIGISVASFDLITAVGTVMGGAIDALIGASVQSELSAEVGAIG